MVSIERLIAEHAQIAARGDALIRAAASASPWAVICACSPISRSIDTIPELHSRLL